MAAFLQQLVMSTVVVPEARPLFFWSDNALQKNNKLHFSCRNKLSEYEKMNLISFCSLHAEPHVCMSLSSGHSFSLIVFYGCPSACVSHLFSGVVERKVSSKVEPTLSQTLIIEEGRRGENDFCNIHMSYWLDCQPLAHAHNTYEVSQMTEDAMLCPPSASSYISLFFPLYVFSSSIHMPPPLSPLPSLLCHLFSCLFPSATSFHPLLICCHFSEERGMPMGQIQL